MGDFEPFEEVQMIGRPFFDIFNSIKAVWAVYPINTLDPQIVIEQACHRVILVQDSFILLRILKICTKLYPSVSNCVHQHP